MKNYLFVITLIIAFLALGCPGTETAKNGNSEETGSKESIGSGQTETAKKGEDAKAEAIGTPTDAVRVLIEGIRAKDEAKMRSSLSKATLVRFDEMAKETKQTFFDVVVGEDLEEMSKLPEMRNEKIDGDKATVELKNDKTEDWDPIPFVKEDGSWKIALFDNAPDEGD